MIQLYIYIQGVDEAIDFLDGFGSDPLDVGEALLEFDMEMADAKDIDDGATVAGAMDELLEKDSQLEAAITEIEFKDNLLLEQNSALDAERLRSEQLASELAAMRLRQQQPSRREDLIIITETLIVKMLLYGHSIAGEKVGCKGQELWSGESTTSLNHVRHLQRNRSCSNPPK